MAAGWVPLRSEKVHFKPTVSCSLAPNSHRISLGRKPHGGGDSSSSSSSSSSLVQERACPFRMFVIAIFACDASCSGSANRPSGGCRDGLTTTPRVAGASLASLEPAISRLWDGPFQGPRGWAGAVFMPACLPAFCCSTAPHPQPPLDSGSLFSPPHPPGPLLAAVQYCFCVSFIDFSVFGFCHCAQTTFFSLFVPLFHSYHVLSFLF